MIEHVLLFLLTDTWCWYSWSVLSSPFPYSIKTFHSPLSLVCTWSIITLQEPSRDFCNLILWLSALKVNDMQQTLLKWRAIIKFYQRVHLLIGFLRTTVYLVRSGCRRSFGKEICSWPRLSLANGPCSLQKDQFLSGPWKMVKLSPSYGSWNQSPWSSLKYGNCFTYLSFKSSNCSLLYM